MEILPNQPCQPRQPYVHCRLCIIAYKLSMNFYHASKGCGNRALLLRFVVRESQVLVHHCVEELLSTPLFS